MSRSYFPLLAMVLALCTATSSGQSQDESPLLLPLEGSRTSGAPSKANVGKTVLLTDIRSTDPWYAAVKVLKAAGYRDVVSVTPWNPERAFKALGRKKPGAVVCVFRPETIDVNFHFDFLERASRLDKDPFVDFAFGYITGGSPEEMRAFAAAAVAAKKKKRWPKSILEFGPSTRPQDPTSEAPHKWAKGFTNRRWSHPEDASDIATRLGKLRPKGVLSAWGHGMPDGVEHGMPGASLVGEQAPDLSACLYFSGPCYCGVPAGWYRNDKGKIVRESVAPEESFLLGLLRARVAAAFAGLDPDRGETNHHEREHVLLGSTLGAASKATYDDVVIARRTPRLELIRYEVGKRRPHANVRETMIMGGACRALFGLPDWAPYAKADAGDDPFAVRPRKGKKGKGIVLDWEGEDYFMKFWMPVDIFNGTGGWTHRLRFKTEVPFDAAKKIRSLEVDVLTKDGKPLEQVNTTAAFEHWGGKVFLHLTVPFPRNEQDRALFNGKEFRARFHLN